MAFAHGTAVHGLACLPYRMERWLDREQGNDHKAKKGAQVHPYKDKNWKENFLGNYLGGIDLW